MLQLYRESLDGADLQGERFGSRSMQGARLREADLSNSNCARGDWRDADLQGALLAGVSFKGCALRGTNLLDCQFSEHTDFTGARFSQETRCDLEALVKAGVRGLGI